MSRLLDKYKNEVIKALMEKFSYKNVMQVPKLEKIVINMACGDAVGNYHSCKKIPCRLETS